MSEQDEADRYIKTQNEMVQLAAKIRWLKLDLFLNQISNAETIAPILDPTLYRKASNNVQALKKLAQTMLPVQEAFDELMSTVVETSARGDMQPMPGIKGVVEEPEIDG